VLTYAITVFIDCDGFSEFGEYLLTYLLTYWVTVVRMLVVAVCNVYRSDRVTLIDTYQYNDSASDAFQREPYCVKFLLHETGARRDHLVDT